MTEMYGNIAPLPTVPTVPSHGLATDKHQSPYASINLDKVWSASADRTQNPFSEYSLHGLRKDSYISHEAHNYGGSEFKIMRKRAYVWRQMDRKTEAEFDAEARELFKQFLGCQGFSNYRTRKKKSKSSNDGKWPDNIEWAFFRALVRYRPVGRDQTRHPAICGGKPMGRNELIGHFITIETGCERGRKQISSHLQVLRPYVVHKPHLLGYLISQKELPKWNRSQIKKGRPTGRISTHGIGTYSLPTPSALSDLGHHIDQREFTENETHSWTFRQFDLLLCPAIKIPGAPALPSSKQPPLGEPSHTYSSSSEDSRLQDAKVEGADRSFELFPEVFTSQHTRPISNPIMALDASIQLPRPNLAYGNHHYIAVDLRLTGPRVQGDAIVDTITTFYQNCNEISSAESFGSVIDTFGLGPHSVTYHVPFNSDFWAKFLHRLGGSAQRAARLHPNDSNLNQAAAAEAAMLNQRTAQELRSLTAIQQVTVYGTAQPDIKHHVTLRWQFKPAPSNAPGHTGWCFVEIPAIETELPSPTDSKPSASASFSASAASSADFDAAGSVSEPSTPEVCMDGGAAADAVAADMQHAGGVGQAPRLRSPIALRNDSQAEWIGKMDEASQAFSFEDIGAFDGLEMGSVGGYGEGHVQQHPLDNLGQQGAEADFNFADFDYAAVQGHGFANQAAQIPMDPSLVGMDQEWCFVEKAAETGLGLEMGEHQGQAYHEGDHAVEGHMDVWGRGSDQYGQAVAARAERH